MEVRGTKRVIPLLSILLLICVSLVGCGGTSKTTSYLEVYDKEYSDKRYIIVVGNPYDEKAEAIKLDVERNVWNLIQTGSMYLVSYESKGDKRKITSIKHPHESNSEEGGESR